MGLTPGSSNKHLHTNSKQNTEDGTRITITRGGQEKPRKTTKIGKNKKQNKKWLKRVVKRFAGHPLKITLDDVMLSLRT
jgi:hypothetical protein